jgi:phosphoribosylglycinamide formyltransferase 2
MVTLIRQEPSEIELHLRAKLGLQLGPIVQRGPSASAVILADRAATRFRFEGVGEALGMSTAETPVDLRLFGKPETLVGRRMGVALARAASIEQAVAAAKTAAASVSIAFEEEK